MRCCTVLLACGWLLFYPPFPPGQFENWDGKRPLTEWHHSGSFDTAAECEQSKTKEVSRMGAAVSAVEDPQKQQLLNAVAYYQAGRCVPSDALGFKMK
ncbi:MAG: hypothetical protein HY695_23695 [Deltaproteobacteria bacterium]|nr:hypothetical protein [Deltaproteobacteria bacterium]